MGDTAALLRRLRRVRDRVRRRSDPVNMLAGAWAFRALSRLRKDLKHIGTSAAVLPPPRLPKTGVAGVRAVLERRRATCLERSLVLQRWLASQGHRTDVVIGVSAPGEGFAAHAWLADYVFDPESLRYRELTRIPPPTSDLSSQT